MPIRLSHKAQEAAAMLSGSFEGSIRKIASALAEQRGAEFADANDVKEAARLHICTIAKRFMEAEAKENGLQPT